MKCLLHKQAASLGANGLLVVPASEAKKKGLPKYGPRFDVWAIRVPIPLLRLLPRMPRGGCKRIVEQLFGYESAVAASGMYAPHTLRPGAISPGHAR